MSSHATHPMPAAHHQLAQLLLSRMTQHHQHAQYYSSLSLPWHVQQEEQESEQDQLQEHLQVLL